MEDLFSFSSRSNKNWTGKETPVLDNTQMVAKEKIVHRGQKTC
jgi:hypothetical protein